jgi:hypothetical protein
MERAAVRNWAARRAMIVLGALLTTASGAEYVNAAIEVLKPASAQRDPDRRPRHRKDGVS